MALMAPAAAQAAVRYAAPSGGLTSGECTTRETACEVNRAVEVVGQAGDEVILIAGVYEVGNDQILPGPGMNVHGEASARHTEIASSATLPAVALNQDGARLADVTVTHNTGQFGAVSLSSQSTVERVIARSSLANVQTCQLWKGTIRDTVCWSSGANGQAAGTSLAGPGGTHTPQLVNVTAIGTGSGSTGVSFNAAGAGVNIAAELRNVIADGPAGDIRAFSSNGGGTTSVNATSSLFSQTVTNPGGVGVTPGTITANNAQGNVPSSATFVSPSLGNFHQKANSLSIDRGTSVSGSGIGTADFDGQGRISGEEVDIGADEFIENDVRHAEPNGNGPEPCLEADPCDIRAAFSGAAKDGDEVVLSGGTYDLNAQSADITEAVHAHPAPGAEVLVTGTGTYGITMGDAGSRLSDVTIDMPEGTPLFLSNGTVERVQARTSGGGDNACSLGRGLVRDTTCFSDAAINGGGAGLNMSASGTWNLKLRNVTAVAVGPGSSGMRFGMSGGSLNVDARNVIASGVEEDVNATGNTTMDMDNSNYSSVQWAAGGTVTDAGTLANQTDEPKFADLAGGDLHQLADSPTVDRGMTDVDVSSADLDGEARFQGPAVDIGADELTVIPPADQSGGGQQGQTAKPVKAAKKCKKRKAGKTAKRKRCKKPKRR